MIPGAFAAFSEVLGRLEKAGIPYMVVGSVASIVYGEARMTHDLDLVLDLPIGAVGQLNSAFSDEVFYISSP